MTPDDPLQSVPLGRSPGSPAMLNSSKSAVRPPRRWLQFRLRTLLIGTAVVAVFLGVAVRWIAPAQRQRAAVRWAAAVGGWAVYRESPTDQSWLVTKLRSLLPRD